MSDEVRCLSKKSREIVTDFSNDLFLSSISVWEISNKYRQGKLQLLYEPYEFVKIVSEKFAIEQLSFDLLSCRHLQNLPLIHKDPYDRMLICQAMENKMAIITDDKIIMSYPVRTIW